MKALEEIGPIECQGYGATLTPWWCIENQLSIYCLPDFPCHDCQAAVGIRVAGEDSCPTKDTGRGACAIKEGAAARPRRLPKDWDMMTPAVRKSWLRDNQ